MNKLIVVVLLVACAQAEAGEFYIEAGTLYTENRIRMNGVTESGLIGHIALGYEIREGNLSIDFQIRHESDPTQTGERDLTNKNAAGIMSRYRF